MGRHAQSHGRSHPGVDGVAVLQVLDIHGVAGDGVQADDGLTVQDHLVQGLIPAGVFYIQAAVVQPGQGAPHLHRTGTDRRSCLVRGLCRRGGDRQQGGAQEQGQALQNPLFHNSFILSNASGERLLRLPV